MRKCFVILTTCGIILVMSSIILGVINKDMATAIGTISTIVSIILGMGSFVYSFVSGEKTSRYLDDIRKENAALVERLNYELSKENYGQKNLESIDRMIDRDINV